MPNSPLSAFAEMTAASALWQAFQKVRANGGGPGGDGETARDFERQADFRIARLAAELQSGLYRPGPLKRVEIPKKSGGTRTLRIPCLVDRIAQTAAAAVLSRRLEPHFEPSSFAYRPGRSVKQAVARVAALRRAGYRFVVDGDIRSFFDEVPHDLVLERLAAHVADERVSEIVALWLASFGDGRGLAQGSPLSPLLSNLHLDAVDEAFENGPVRIVRFADDFVLLAKTQARADAALARVADLLAERGLTLNLAKTRVIAFEDALSFLGHLFVRSVVLEEEEEDAAAPAAVCEARALRISQERDEERSVAGPEPEPSTAAAPAVTLIRRPAAEPDPLTDLESDRDADDFAVGLAPLYILEPGRRLGVEGEAFAVYDGTRRLVAIPARLVGRIDIGADALADQAALRLAAEMRVPIAFLDGRLQPLSWLTPRESENAALHLAQARRMLHQDSAAALARALVAGRLRNCHALLKRLNRRRKDPQVEACCERLHRIRRKAAILETIDALRGVEGEGAALYWPALGHCLEHGATLRRRRADEAREPMNIALDFTASLLTRDMRAAILRAGLHPGFGALHVAGDGRDACVYDLIEAFRAPLSEGLAVYLFNNRILSRDDFSEREGSLRLGPQGARRLVQAYEAWLARPVKNPRAGTRTSWRNLLLAEARAFAAAARADAPFLPYALDY